MAYRVIQCGTGNVGRHSLRAIIERPDLELAGVRVYSGKKAGTDAGELVQGKPVGIAAVTTLDEVLQIPADCVNYAALGTTEDAGGQPIDEICTLLEHGYNVTSSALEFTIYPPSTPEPLRARLAKACEAGGSTYFGAGVNPGFTMDLWPVTMSRLSRRIDRIRMLESLDMRDYSSTSAMAFMGFGLAPDAPSPMDGMHSEAHNSPYYSSMLLVAEALRFQLDGYTYNREVGVATDDITTASGIIRRGQVAVTKVTCTGLVGGHEVLIQERVRRVCNDVRPEWAVGEFWEMDIDGDPSMHCHLDAKTESDSKRIVSLTVATAMVNAIPTICEASPGLKSVLDLPTWGGGLVSVPA
jgi:4-hydroxy-tetrahydrodipicolinate reductase